MNQSHVFLVRECPCFREFKGETLCVNDDKIVKDVITIDVDPDLFLSSHLSGDFMHSKTDDDCLCFCLAYLAEDGYYYCMSQQKRLRIRGEDVSKEEMNRALEVLLPSGVHFASVLCAECLYNVLVALKEGSGLSQN
ncbi:hypothetical protein EU545_05785 [Candidatus Thorarchaeota archaeon]|nr:MAG: hypothetical protein EU545_05785 [Candidatus Thorarchaeota archaeon]